MTWRACLMVTAQTSAIVCTGGVLWLWWDAAFNGWESCVQFDRFGEQWFEGVMFHVFALVLIITTWRYFGRRTP